MAEIDYEKQQLERKQEQQERILKEERQKIEALSALNSATVKFETERAAHKLAADIAERAADALDASREAFWEAYQRVAVIMTGKDSRYGH